MAAITQLHTFGWANEDLLKASIEKHLGCKIQKTKDRFCTFDWETKLLAVELKSRNGSSKDYNEWIVSTAKLTHPEGKIVYLFYYWKDDNSLWVCEPDRWCQEDWVSEIPPWKDNQMHTYIDSAYFTRVPIEKS